MITYSLRLWSCFCAAPEHASHVFYYCSRGAGRPDRPAEHVCPGASSTLFVQRNNKCPPVFTFQPTFRRLDNTGYCVCIPAHVGIAFPLISLVVEAMFIY
ncbi:hypothetical protein BD309DRAFT_87021 [Dichomitus squalens]|nr:hypothetical protein BD309DRAFT_87021 [Dichomitus squalens]